MPIHLIYLIGPVPFNELQPSILPPPLLTIDPFSEKLSENEECSQTYKKYLRFLEIFGLTKL